MTHVAFKVCLHNMLMKSVYLKLEKLKIVISCDPLKLLSHLHYAIAFPPPQKIACPNTLENDDSTQSVVLCLPCDRNTPHYYLHFIMLKYKLTMVAFSP